MVRNVRRTPTARNTRTAFVVPTRDIAPRSRRNCSTLPSQCFLSLDYAARSTTNKVSGLYLSFQMRWVDRATGEGEHQLFRHDQNAKRGAQLLTIIKKPEFIVACLSSLRACYVSIPSLLYNTY